MPSKKHRPIVMNRNKTPGRTYKILKRAILITAILAFIEVIILVVIHYRNANKTVATKQENPAEIPKVAVKDSPKADALTQPKVIAENKQNDTVLKKDTVEITKPVAEKTKPLAEKTELAVAKPIPVPTKPVKDTATLRKIKPKEIRIARKVTSDEMFDILNQVRTEKLKTNNLAKCISIQIVNRSNVDNGSIIANYLRKNGYVISGREVIQGSQKGIQINAEGPCVKLAIGDL